VFLPKQIQSVVKGTVWVEPIATLEHLHSHVGLICLQYAGVNTVALTCKPEWCIDFFYCLLKVVPKAKAGDLSVDRQQLLLEGETSLNETTNVR
jgi:hypothetical protein